jgi:large subunit ribosomal protein L17
MRHQNRIKKLGRTAAHRKATLAAMATALVEHKRIETTLPKAKALRSYVEPLINRAKEDTTQNRRQVFRRLQSKEAVKELFGDISAQVGDRPGGYTRVIKLGLRQGDAAEMAIIELVDYNDVKPDGSSSGKKKTRRGGGGGRRKKSSGQAPKAAAPAAKSDSDDLTKVYGVGKVFASALNDAGITTFAQLAESDLDTLRSAISEGSEGSDASANEETWAEQAAFLAKGDKAGYDAYIERM